MGPVASITKKWHACLEQVEDSSRRFTNLSDALPAETIASWTSSETFMQELRSVEVEVMDDYDVREEQGKFFSRSPDLRQLITLIDNEMKRLQKRTCN